MRFALLFGRTAMEMYKAFARRLFGIRGGHAVRSAAIFFAIYLALVPLHSGFVIPMRSACGATAAFTCWLTWQDLSGTRDDVKNIFMLPFSRIGFNFAWVSVLAAHILLTKSAILIALIAGLSGMDAPAALELFSCAAAASAMAAAGYSWKKVPGAALFGGAASAVSFFAAGTPWVWGAVALLIAASVIVLANSDSYAFLPERRKSRRVFRDAKAGSVFLSVLRSVFAGSSSRTNTIGMWVISAFLCFVLGPESGTFIPYVCLAVVCVNTPASTILSADPSMQQAVHSLPRQKKMFALPYGAALFVLGFVPEAVFLACWGALGHPIPLPLAAAAIFCAAQSAIFCVYLEWKHPVRGWNTISDLWRHPRKYLVPLVLICAQLLFFAVPAAAYIAIAVCAAEVPALLLLPRSL